MKEKNIRLIFLKIYNFRLNIDFWSIYNKLFQKVLNDNKKVGLCQILHLFILSRQDLSKKNFFSHCFNNKYCKFLVIIFREIDTF